MYDTTHQIPFNEEREIMSYDGNATILEIPEYFESSKYGKVQIKKIKSRTPTSQWMSFSF